MGENTPVFIVYVIAGVHRNGTFMSSLINYMHACTHKHAHTTHAHAHTRMHTHTIDDPLYSGLFNLIDGFEKLQKRMITIDDSQVFKPDIKPALSPIQK